MNKSLLYKEAGGKESARREKYLNQLLNVSGKGSLTLSKHLNANQQLFGTGSADETLGSGFNNSVAKLQTAELAELRRRSHFRNSSQPEGLSALNIQSNHSGEAYHKRVFAVPRIDLTSSFQGHSNPWSYKSSDLPSAVYVSRREPEYLIEDQAVGSSLQSRVVQKENYSLISANQARRTQYPAQKMMTLKKQKVQSQQTEAEAAQQNLPVLHVHTDTYVKAQQSVLQRYSPKRNANTREKPRRDKGFFKNGYSLYSEAKIANAFTKILGKKATDSPPLESERYKRRQRSPHNLGLYLNDERLPPGRTLAENLFRSQNKKSQFNRTTHQSVDLANVSGFDYGGPIKSSQHKAKQNILDHSVQMTQPTKDYGGDSIYSNVIQVNKSNALPLSGSLQANPDVMSPIKISQRDQSSLFSAGGQSKRARLNQFGSYIDEAGREIIPNELHDLPEIAKFTKHDTVQNVHKDIIKYYCQPSMPKTAADLGSDRTKTNNFLTTSNHYKYNRIREGGWGKKKPLDAEKNMNNLDPQLIEQLQYQKAHQQRNGRMQQAAVTQPAATLRHDALIDEQNPLIKNEMELAAFQEPLMSGMSSDHMVIKANIRTIAGQQIFESVEDSEMNANRERNKTMLQDSILEMSQQDQTLGRAELDISSPVTSKRQQNRSQLTAGAVQLPKSTERSKEKEPLLEKSKSSIRKPRGTQDINMMNQYNSNAIHKTFDQSKEVERNSKDRASPSKNQNPTQFSSERTPADPMVSKSFNIRDIVENAGQQQLPLSQEASASQRAFGARQSTGGQHQKSMKTSNYQSTAMDQKDRGELRPDSQHRLMQEITKPHVQLHSKDELKQKADGKDSQLEGWAGSHQARIESAALKQEIKDAIALQEDKGGSPLAHAANRNIVFQQFEAQQQKLDSAKKAGSQMSSLEQTMDKRSKDLSSTRSPKNRAIIFENATIGRSQFPPRKLKQSRGHTRQGRNRHSQDMSTTNTTSFHLNQKNKNMKEFNFDDVRPIQPVQIDFVTERRGSSVGGETAIEQFKIKNKLKDLKTIRHLQQLRKQSIELQRTIEREEKRSIFDRVSDTKTNKLIAGYAHQGLQEQIQHNRRVREKMLEQIQLAEKRIRERRRDVDKQREKNIEAQQGFEHQLELLAKLNNMEQVLRQKDGSYVQTTRQTNSPDLEFKQFGKGHHSVNAPGQPIINQSFFEASTQPATTKRSDPSVDVNDIKGMYKHLFENDLNWTRNRALDELVQFREKQYYCQQEAEHLRKVQGQMKGNIARYKKMIKELEQTDGPLEFLNNPAGKRTIKIEKNVDDILRHGKIVQSSAERAKLQDDILKQEMDQMLFKQSERGTSPPLLSNQDKMSNNSPSGLHRRGSVKGTPMTTKFSAKIGNIMGLSRPLILDIKKLEMITTGMPLIYKQRKPLDQLVMMLQLTQKLFKTQKVVFFLTDVDLANKVLSFGDRKHNYKKIQLESSHTYAIYAHQSNFTQPLFFDPKEVQPIFNYKQIVMPLMDPTNPRSVQMVLQIVNDDKVVNNQQLQRSSNNSSPMGAMSGLQHSQGHKSPTKLKPTAGAGGAIPTSSSRSQLGETEDVSVRSGSQFVAGRRKGTTQSSSTNIGYNHNDRVIAKIMSEMMQMSAQYFYFQVMMKQKIAKIDDVIEFAEASFEIRTYRQIISAFKKNVDKLIGFENCTIFFDNQTTGDLFTLTTQEEDPVEVDKRKQKKKDDPGYIDVAFAQELIFPENEVIECPASMGVSGEVHQRMGIRYENNFGVLLHDKPKRPPGAEDDLENKSESSSYAGGKASVISKSSGLYQKHKSQPSSKLRNKNVLAHQNTKLEQIKEDVQLAEEDQLQSGVANRKAENNTYLQTSNAQSQSSLRVKKSAQSQMEESGLRSNPRGSEMNRTNISISKNQAAGAVGNKTYTVNFNESKLRQRGGDDLETYIQTSEHSLEEKAQQDAQRTQNESSLRHSIEDAANDGFEVIRQQSVHPAKKRMTLSQRRKANENLNKLFDAIVHQGIHDPMDQSSQRLQGLDQEEKYYNQFIPDIDNFEGVKVRNYCVCSQRENAYGFGDRSVGIVQVFNRSDGRPVDHEALRRVQWFARFAGALTEKAAAIRNSFTLIIGMMQVRRDFKADLSEVDSSEIGEFNTIMLQMDIIWKPTADLEKNAEDQEQELRETQQDLEACKTRLQAIEEEENALQDDA